MPPPEQPRRPGQPPDPEKKENTQLLCAWCDMPVDAGEVATQDGRDVAYHVKCLKAAVKLLNRLRSEK